MFNVFAARPLMTLAGVAVLTSAAFAGVAYVHHLRGQAAAYADCRDLVAHPDGKPAACAPGVATAIVRAALAEACDAGLDAERSKPGAGVLAVARSCSGPVKRLDGQALTLAREVADRDGQLVALRADHQADVALAVARTETLNRRKTDAEKTISGAPRDPGGRVVCGAECLRQLAGDARRPGS